jgi:hypothetical protein
MGNRSTKTQTQNLKEDEKKPKEFNNTIEQIKSDMVLKGHENWVHGIHINQNYLVSASYEGIIKTWKKKNNEYELSNTLNPTIQKYKRLASVSSTIDNFYFAVQDNYDIARSFQGSSQSSLDNFIFCYSYNEDDTIEKKWEISTDHKDLIYYIHVDEKYVFAGSRDYTSSSINFT